MSLNSTDSDQCLYIEFAGNVQDHNVGGAQGDVNSK